MSKLIANILKMIGGVGASAGSNACVMFFVDEPTMPKSLIER